MKRSALLVILLLMGGTIGLSVAQIASADFNAATGFSGRSGFTCTSCHNIPDLGPAGNGEVYPEDAQVHLDGLPDAWELGASYNLTVRVTGGPPAMPAPAPQGGFEIESDEGAFLVPDAMADLIRVYADDGRGVTYTPEGTLVREWQVTWVAPLIRPAANIRVHSPGGFIDEAPEDARFWVAGMAANGNHVVALGRPDQGELGDSVRNITLTVPPSADALAAWEAVRIEPPAVNDLGPLVPFEPVTVTGRHNALDATHVGHRINDGAWGRLESTDTWALRIAGLPPGEHELWVRTETLDRVSEAVLVPLAIDAEAEPPVPRSTPFPVVTLLALLVLRRRA